MEGTMQTARAGWSPEEADRLWREVRAASDTGASLRDVFERMGQALGRKPNSVRNYYYMHLRAQGDESCKRAAPFSVFSEDEIRELMRRVLRARGQGQSVRACVMDLSHGDKALMLRYQNKYRAVLKKRPQLVEEICRELQESGQPCPQVQVKVEPLPVSPAAPWDDPDAQAIFASVSALVKKSRRQEAPESDRLRVQRDLTLLQLEDMQTAIKNALSVCKEFLGEAPEARTQRLPAFCQQLSEQVAKLETVSG